MNSEFFIKSKQIIKYLYIGLVLMIMSLFSIECDAQFPLLGEEDVVKYFGDLTPCDLAMSKIDFEEKSIENKLQRITKALKKYPHCIALYQNYARLKQEVGIKHNVEWKKSVLITHVALIEKGMDEYMDESIWEAANILENIGFYNYAIKYYNIALKERYRSKDEIQAHLIACQFLKTLQEENEIELLAIPDVPMPPIYFLNKQLLKNRLKSTITNTSGNYQDLISLIRLADISTNKVEAKKSFQKLRNGFDDLIVSLDSTQLDENLVNLSLDLLISLQNNKGSAIEQNDLILSILDNMSLLLETTEGASLSEKLNSLRGANNNPNAIELSNNLQKKNEQNNDKNAGLTVTNTWEISDLSGTYECTSCDEYGRVGTRYLNGVTYENSYHKIKHNQQSLTMEFSSKQTALPQPGHYSVFLYRYYSTCNLSDEIFDCELKMVSQSSYNNIESEGVTYYSYKTEIMPNGDIKVFPVKGTVLERGFDILKKVK